MPIIEPYSYMVGVLDREYDHDEKCKYSYKKIDDDHVNPRVR